MKPYSLRSIVLTYRMGTALLRRGTLAGAVGLALADAIPAYATEPSNAELLERIKRLEKKNEDQEKAFMTISRVWRNSHSGACGGRS
jgi:predicted DNA-binding transcriptional regulator